MKYVYLIYEECHGMVGVFPDEATANAVVKDLATAYDYKVKDPTLTINSLMIMRVASPKCIGSVGKWAKVFCERKRRYE